MALRSDLVAIRHPVLGRTAKVPPNAVPSLQRRGWKVVEPGPPPPPANRPTVTHVTRVDTTPTVPDRDGTTPEEQQ